MTGPADQADQAFSVPSSLDGVRLDRAVSLLTGISRAEASVRIAEGKVRVDGRPETRRSAPVAAGNLVSLSPGRPVAPPGPEPHVPLEVVFADDDVIVVDKPWDLVVHPGAGHREGTLVGAVLARFPDVGGLVATGDCEPDRPGIVHRLDRGTSGLLVVARSPRALRSLREQLDRRGVVRRYGALVHGHLEHDRGVVDAPMGRSIRRPTRMSVSAAGREARTGYQVVARYERPVPATLVVATLETGRTHQIRVHLAAIGHPVVGDAAYGPPTGVPGLDPGRFFLHAFELGFDHPADGRPVRIRAPLAPDLVAVLGEAPELD